MTKYTNMRKKLLLLALSFTIFNHAQEYGFGIFSDYSMTSNAYEFTFVATPNFSNPDPNFADIQLTLAISTGNTIQANSVNEILGSGWQVNTALTGPVLQTNFGIGDGSKDLWIFTLPVPTSALTVAHTMGEGIPVLSFVVDNTPNSGTLEILDNSDPISVALNNVGFDVNNLINVDLDDGNGVQDYFGGFSPGAFNYSFSVLDTQDDIDISQLSIYPNPVSDKLFILGNINSVDSIELYNITGQLVTQFDVVTNQLDVSILEGGVYFIKLNSNDRYKVFKFIKD